MGDYEGRGARVGLGVVLEFDIFGEKEREVQLDMCVLILLLGTRNGPGRRYFFGPSLIFSYCIIFTRHLGFPSKLSAEASFFMSF